MQKRGSLSIIVAMIDIDFFKKVNDNYGHAAGDAALKSMAELLTNEFRGSDVIARFGGEEFCLLLVYKDFTAMLNKLNNFRTQIENNQVVHEKTQFTYTISIGIASDLSDSLEDMINKADLKLYEAKETDRNKIVH
jgi:diguanylate cyclase (GGDEF)-like protein